MEAGKAAAVELPPRPALPAMAPETAPSTHHARDGLRGTRAERRLSPCRRTRSRGGDRGAASPRVELTRGRFSQH